MTLAQKWIPDMSEVLTMVLPLPMPFHADNTERWNECKFGFEAPAQLRVQKDQSSKQAWRRRLPRSYDDLLQCFITSQL